MKSGDGSISEWNEGNLKSLRLHEAQEMINIGKINPLQLSNDGISWNFEMWIAGINILCGEGKAKYSDNEIQEIDKIKDLVESRKKFFYPIKKVKKSSIGSTQQQHLIDVGNWEHLKKLIDIYEHKTKLFNDMHGLSTRNMDDFDDGL